ncbi:MAG: RNA polymerase sigma factor [Polyangiaceae bacterium]
MNDRERIAAEWESHRPALTQYLARLVARQDVASELVQETAVRALEQQSVPNDAALLRAWFFRVATNLGLDYLRKHSTWRENMLDLTKLHAQADAQFLADSRQLAGSPEMKSIAKDHVAVCFACTSRNLEPEESAVLLLKEVYDFTVEEVAEVIQSSFGRTKALLQSARARLEAKYQGSCALVAQNGACFQCVELDRYFRAGAGDPLAGTRRDLDARLELVRARRDSPLGPWHQAMMRLVAEVLDEGPLPEASGSGSPKRSS